MLPIKTTLECVSSLGAYLLENCLFSDSDCVEFTLGQVGFSSCGMQSQFPHGTWDLLGQGIEPVFLALAGGLLTTGPPGKS